MSSPPADKPAYDPSQVVLYKRSRFQSRLPKDRLYTPSHFWNLVEHGFEVKSQDPIKVGQAIGWLEGFKALTDLYSVLDGQFIGPNPDAEQDTTLVDKDPYGRGWLYLARGMPEPNSVDVHGYIQVLDAAIDKMQS